MTPPPAYALKPDYNLVVGPLLLPSGPIPLLLEAWATVRVFSYGGGGQSNGVLALQALGRLHNPYDYFVFANVGADSENPETLEYIEKYAKPFCEKHSIKFVEVQKTRFGKPDTLLSAINRDDRSVPIPAYMSKSGAPGNRSCTQDFKVKVIDKWIKKQGFKRAVIGLGISTDELRRVKSTVWHDRYYAKKPFGFWKRREYPLIELRLSRNNAIAAIIEVGLPEPESSACWFCPFTKLRKFAHMCKVRPQRFKKVVAVEDRVNDKRSLPSKDRLFLSSTLLPIAVAVQVYEDKHNTGQLALWDEREVDGCDEGVCDV